MMLRCTGTGTWHQEVCEIRQGKCAVNFQGHVFAVSNFAASLSRKCYKYARPSSNLYIQITNIFPSQLSFTFQSNIKMQFTALALLGMATAATCAAVPELFERSPLCVRGPKHAGDECDPSNWNSKTCGPGNDGNIVSYPPK